MNDLSILTRILISVLMLLFTVEAAAQDIELGEEYSEHSKPIVKTVIVKEKREEKSKTVLEHVLLYLPNRLLDFIDMFKADVGVGPAFGVVARATKYGQVAYRSVSPISLRAGIRGREFPLFIERSSEIGVGPLFLESHDRNVTPLEFGAGVDLFLVGAYLGFSFDELADFLGGLVFIDFKDDDI